MIGNRPQRGFRQIDGLWLRGLSDGDNRNAQNNLVAFAGGGQANALVLSAERAFIQVDTVASAGDSVALPLATVGNSLKVFNNGANSMNIYANPATNKLTGVPDVINKTANATAYALASGAAVEFFCAKDGIWAAIKTA